MTDEQRELIEDVLMYVNKARVAIGLGEILDLPAGHRNESESCPIAMGFAEINCIVDGAWIEFDDWEQAELARAAWSTRAWQGEPNKIKCPKVFEEFVIAFDDKLIPEYDLSPEPPDPDEDDGDDEEGDDPEQ